MKRTVVVLLALAARALPQAPAAEPAAARDPYERVAPSADLSLLDALWTDAAFRLDVRDQAVTPVLNGRLQEIGRETRLWETVLAYARQGRVVDLVDLRPTRLRDAADLDAERKLTDDARARLADAERRAALARAAAPKQPETSRKPTGHGGALLDVVFEAPAVDPDARPAPSPRLAVDAAGLSRALFEAGDFQGSLDALATLADDALTPELRYRRAKCLEKLRRPDVRKAYEATVAADPEGFYGRQAKWMLELTVKTDAASAPLRKPAATPEKRP
ncbi:MAG TPA: hypothetical protein VEI02_11760 [Planctomycetota bacterium]|nr:hypothetical protein [Planctomycetota bacterium]